MQRSWPILSISTPRQKVMNNSQDSMNCVHGSRLTSIETKKRHFQLWTKHSNSTTRTSPGIKVRKLKRESKLWKDLWKHATSSKPTRLKWSQSANNYCRLTMQIHNCGSGMCTRNWLSNIRTKKINAVHRSRLNRWNVKISSWIHT